MYANVGFAVVICYCSACLCRNALRHVPVNGCYIFRIYTLRYLYVYLTLFIEIAFDTLLRCLLKLFLYNLYSRQTAVGWLVSVELLTVLLHYLLKIGFVESHCVGFVEVGIYKTDEFFAALHYNRLVHHSQ